VVDDPQTLKSLKNAMLVLQADLTEARRTSLEGRILAALLELAMPQARIHYTSVRDRLKPSQGSPWSVGSRDVGRICKQFGLPRGKDRDGYYVVFAPADHGPLLSKYGLAPPSEGHQAA
jgi:hypothetical protein